MKLLLTLLAVAASVEVSFALFGHSLTRDGSLKKNKYDLNREPPLDPFAVVNDEETVSIRWIEQSLNHFDPQDNRTWQMRYMENNFFLQDGGPIFIYVGGEWTISQGWLLSGHMHDMARDLNGTMFYTEHRYYGSSHPTPDLTNDNLRYLNIDQALADLAHFIQHIKETIPEVANSGVVMVGGSYSATMVTWFLQKYPHLASGAWSSSAPLEAKVDFVEYKEVVSEAIQLVGGSECAGRVERAFTGLERMVELGQDDRIEELFRLCYPLDLSNQMDVWSIFSDISDSFSGVVQYHREASQNIQMECDILVNNDIEDDVEALSHWWWFGSSPDRCWDHRFSSWIAYYNGTGWTDAGARSSMRQWIYQTCAEYGWYQSSGSDDIIFGSSFPVEVSLQLCIDLYSEFFSHETVQRNVDRTNTIYGELNPSVRNVYSTHGQLDPWRAMGIQVDINEHSPTVILPLEAHCSDLYSMSASDTPEMTASKEKIFELSKQWLGITIEEIPVETTEVPIETTEGPAETIETPAK